MQSKLYKGGVIPCFDYIEWQGRQVILAFDADAMTNQHIQAALARLNGILQERGAEVLVIYTPPVNGDNSAGIDDYLASGGDIYSLFVQVAPYTPIDVTHERLARNPELREHIEGIEQYLLTADWRQRGGARSILKGLLCIARHEGKIVEREAGKGILVQASYRFIAEQEKISKETVVANIKKMEKGGLVIRDRTLPRKQRDPMYFLILSDSLLRDWYNNGESDAQRYIDISSSHIVPVPHLSNPRLRNSAPRYGLSDRIGKRGEAILDTMLVISDGGAEYVEEGRLSELLHYKTLKSMRDSKVYKRLISWGVLDNKTVEGSVCLTPDWRTFLQMAMDDRLKHESDNKQANLYSRQRRRFKNRHRDETG